MDTDTNKTLYTSMKSLHSAMGIPIIQLKLAKTMNAPGFNSNNSINWMLLKPWLDENQHQLKVDEKETWEYYRIQNAIKDGVLKDQTKVINDEQIKRLKGESLDPQEVKEFLSKVSAKQAIVFKSTVKDLSSKYPHLKTELEDLVKEVCSIFQDEEIKWMK